jgi:nucleoside-diphosphate-sugar epimerase
MRKVLVTGASGFIGSNLVETLRGLSVEAVCPVRSERSAKVVTDLGGRPVAGDLSTAGAWAAELADVDAVFHLAGLVRAHRAEDYHRHNVRATAELLAALNTHGHNGQRLIVLSSLAAAGPCDNPPGRDEDAEPGPVSDYGRTKLAAERLAMREAERRFTAVVRAPAVYGPRDVGFLPLFRAIKAGIAPIFGGRDFPLSLIYVNDLVHVMIALARDAVEPSILHLSDGIPHTWRGLCESIAEKMDARARFFPIPIGAIRCLCALNGVFDRFRSRASFLNPDKWNEIRAPGWLSHSTRSRQELGLPPAISLGEGIEGALRWYRDRKWL